jgi:hypothetical protein
VGLRGYLRRHHVGLIAAFLALSGTAVAAFDPIGPDGDIDACYSKKTKQLTLQKKSKCKRGTKPVSWSQTGPQGAQGAAGSQGSAGATGPAGVAGAAGTARGYGLVQPSGLLTHSRNSSVSRVGVGIFCVTVQGASPSTDPILLTADYSTIVNGSATVVDTADTLQGGSSQNPIALWDPTPETCSASQWEVQTAEQRVDANANSITVLNLEDEGFSFLVP